MKLALIFLSTLMVVSQQQYQRQRTLNWMSPYIAQRYPDYQPQFYDDFQDNRPSYYRYFKPNIPAVYSEESEVDPQQLLGLAGVQQDDQDDYADAQSRVKGFNRFQSSFMQPNQRFLLNLLGVTANNIFPRTVTFTITSTINITSVQSCISSNLFSNAAAQSSNCRRRRDVAKFYDDIDDANDVQFSIQPTETQLVQGTAIASGDMLMPRNYATNQEIVSSKEETAMEYEAPRARQKRFFFLNTISTKTVTSYTFLSTVITKAVPIVASAAAGPLLCKPAGYVIC